MSVDDEDGGVKAEFRVLQYDYKPAPADCRSIPVPLEFYLQVLRYDDTVGLKLCLYLAEHC
jgi:hypothetical protein